MRDTVSRQALRTAVQRAGCYPALVEEALDLALADEPVEASVVHHEPHFDRDELVRHVTAVVLTPTRLVIAHADEWPPEAEGGEVSATVSTESVAVSRVSSVVVSRTVGRPASYASGDPSREVVLTLGWGGVSRVELEPAACSDPQCEADHGFTGTLAGEDLTLRVSADADGAGPVRDLLRLARAVSVATARPGR
jgi:Family of unknown function (DUF5998)